MPRSISPVLRTLIGLTSTPSDGATAWMAANCRIPKDCRSRHARRDLLEQFQPFPADAVFQIDKSRGVAARARQALDEAAADRIGDVYEHDWDRPSHLQQGFQGRGARSQDGVWCEG